MTFFCPQAVDFGNVADWAAVVVAIGAAGSVWYLGLQSHNTAKASKELAEAVSKREGLLQQREQILTGALLWPELVKASVHYRRLANELQKIGTLANFDEHDEARQQVLLQVRAGIGGTLHDSRDKLKLLPEVTGNGIAMGLGFVTTAEEMALQLHELRILEGEEITFKHLVKNIHGAAQGFEQAKEDLRVLLKTQD